jgi:hypothetical protein
LAMDIEDGLAVADPGHACVWLLDRHGVPRHRIMSCAGRTLTNLAYDGHDLFITDSETGQILKARANTGHIGFFSLGRTSGKAFQHKDFQNAALLK